VTWQIRHGITRTVILTRRHAVKLPSLRGHSTGGLRGRLHGFAAGIIANHSEADWHAFEDWGGQVAPVLRSWLGGIVNVYPRCDPLPVNADGDYVGAEPLPVLDPDPGDDKPDNYGILNGRIVRIDYDMG
jgi:hypothetical protein